MPKSPSLPLANPRSREDFGYLDLKLLAVMFGLQYPVITVSRKFSIGPTQAEKQKVRAYDPLKTQNTIAQRDKAS